MRKPKSWTVALILLATATLGWSQTRPVQKRPKETKSVDVKFASKPVDPFTDNIITQEKRLWEASKNADKATYAGLLANDYYEVSDLGISSRADALENLEGPVTKYDL